MEKVWLSAICLLVVVAGSWASVGDQSPFYQKCLRKCTFANCTDDGLQSIHENNMGVDLKLLQWSCKDNCKYQCMWDTVEAFHERQFKTPQFNGKWPFIRMFGIQEPASTVFSMLNWYANWKMLKRFRQEVDFNSPLYWLWHIYGLVSLNAWFWSTVFHARDFPMTELLDYSCAFSMVLMNCYCMTIRILRNKVPRFVLLTLTIFYMAFFANHVAYLRITNIDYTYNMQVNLLVGTFTAICWFGWCTWNRFRLPYVSKCAIFVALTGLVMLLDIIDRPPFLYIFDSHSLWHLSTAPLITLFYSFAIDDCKYLYKTEFDKFKTV